MIQKPKEVRITRAVKSQISKEFDKRWSEGFGQYYDIVLKFLRKYFANRPKISQYKEYIEYEMAVMDYKRKHLKEFNDIMDSIPQEHLQKIKEVFSIELYEFYN